ncbi:MAG: SRPBCC family protein [Bacteroidales bacterium]|jgi:uncharacterized protein YndB with AHSA1/START domain|nr:SRPBCC family protein [Bacteroidales bacterium]
MKTFPKKTVTVEADIHAPVEKVWQRYNSPFHIIRWNHASDDWHTPRAENDLRKGGRFLSRMEARDGSSGFDFTGVYTDVKPLNHIAYILDDDRKVEISFISERNMTTITITFEAELTNPVELQKEGWQSILNNFRKYVEESVTQNSMHFEISIKASVEVVYKTMLEAETYSQWTSVFNPSSHFSGSWEKGSRIYFLGNDRDGNLGGMVSTIRENIPNRFVSIEHLGIVEDGEEIYSGHKVEGWAGALENYTFIPKGSDTLLEIDLDVDSNWKIYFDETWPKALDKLKLICER